MALQFFIHSDLSKNKHFHSCCCDSLCGARLKDKDFGKNIHLFEQGEFFCVHSITDYLTETGNCKYKFTT